MIFDTIGESSQADSDAGTISEAMDHDDGSSTESQEEEETQFPFPRVLTKDKVHCIWTVIDFLAMHEKGLYVHRGAVEKIILLLYDPSPDWERPTYFEKPKYPHRDLLSSRDIEALWTILTNNKKSLLEFQDPDYTYKIVRDEWEEVRGDLAK